MCDMAVSQDVVVRSNGSGFSIASGAMDRYILAKNIIVPNLGACQAALPFKVLGLEANAGKWKDFILLSKAGMAVNDNMGMKPATPGEHHVLPNNTIGADLATGVDLCLGMNYGRRGDHRNLSVNQHKGDFRFTDWFAFHLAYTFCFADLSA
jgi:hypothetical protein